MITEEKKEPVTKSRKVLTTIGVILCVILIPILVINCTLIVKSVVNKNEVPGIGSITPMIVLTDSMSPEINSGDLVILHKADPEDVEEGDIICFFDPAGNGTTTVTHRVVEVTTDENGELAFRTKGDVNNAADKMLAPADSLIGVYSTSFAGLGDVAMFMQTTQGLVICVICPIILLVLYDIIRRRNYEKKKDTETEDLMKELEELRRIKENQNLSDK